MSEIEEITNKIKEDISKRQKANLEILDHLRTLINKHSELRFGQLLAIYAFNDPTGPDAFYEESVSTLAKLKYAAEHI